MSWLDSYTHRALAEAALVGCLCGAVGLHVVLRRMSFFAMAMTHATFPGVAVAAVLGLNIYLGGAVAGLLACMGVLALSRRPDQGATTATGAMLATGFALGVAVLSAADGFSRNLEAFMTGSLITVTDKELVTTTGVFALVVLLLTAFHKELLHGAFDREGQRAAGYPVAGLDLLLLLLVEAVIVVTAPAIGVMLTMALLVGPTAIARLWTDRVGTTVFLSVFTGTASCALGLAISTHWNLAAGGTVTLVIATGFLISLPLSPLRSSWRSHGRTPSPTG
ncbi:metal ABC transporter permease [Streptomyces sp. DSM 42041]|uniref:Metal ABC transporter permease n=1 Tax=Streptomyces hazeniae TaxID=3075538 RepID=A0ABU2P1G6_9ACTN|nr:metal ABC transporter permease [Streptomyces sp. DSM 42041]MDT0382283.1 metal ABC transporter permease [Streptomyces sp. DSM 42041]